MENFGEARSENKINTRKIKFTAVGVLLIAAVCFCVLSVCAWRHFNAMTDSQAKLLITTAEQMEISVGERFEKLERAGSIVTSDPLVLSFNATDEKLDRYEKNVTLNEITEFIDKISLMDSYCDFALIYKNNESAGRLSSGTEKLMTSDSYSFISSLMNGEGSVWAAGVNNDFKRIYHLRRVNDSTVFVSSFFTSELSELFADERQRENSEIYFTAPDNRIVYSSEGNTGETLDSDHIYDEAAESCTVVDGQKIECVRVLKNGWKLFCELDNSSAVRVYRKTAVISAVMAAAAIVILILCSSLLDPQSGSAKGLAAAHKAVDKLTGLYSAETAENLIADKIETCISGSTLMLALVKVINFELIPHSFGAEETEKAILTVSQTIREMYSDGENDKKNIVGRTGENEFIIFADFTQYDLFKAHDDLMESVKELDRRLSLCELTSDRGMIKCAVGAAVYPDSSADYDDLYECAKQSLDEAEKKYGSGYVIYRRSEAKEEQLR